MSNEGEAGGAIAGSDRCSDDSPLLTRVTKNAHVRIYELVCVCACVYICEYIYYYICIYVCMYICHIDQVSHLPSFASRQLAIVIIERNWFTRGEPRRQCVSISFSQVDIWRRCVPRFINLRTHHHEREKEIYNDDNISNNHRLSIILQENIHIVVKILISIKKLA